MPKRIIDVDEESENQFDEDDEQMGEELEEEEQEEKPRMKPKLPALPPLPPARPRPQVQRQQPTLRQEPAPQVRRRFEAFQQPEIIGVRDAETGEVIAQGFNNVGDAMIGAESLERLERIENSIGSMMK